MLDAGLLKVLVCPETHQPLRAADGELIRKLNGQITAGTLRSRAGKLVADGIDGGLVREDGRWVYPIRGQLPILLIDEALPMPA